jgi:hypothetical protein
MPVKKYIPFYSKLEDMMNTRTHMQIYFITPIHSHQGSILEGWMEWLVNQPSSVPSNHSETEQYVTRKMLLKCEVAQSCWKMIYMSQVLGKHDFFVLFNYILYAISVMKKGPPTPVIVSSHLLSP